MNTLDQHIHWAIWNYPSLYRVKTYEQARLRVLDHLFFTIGNGLEWDTKRGILVDTFDGDLAAREEPVPADFYGRNLFEILDFDEEKFKRARKKPGWWYITDGHDLVFEAKDRDEALPFFVRFDKKARGADADDRKAIAKLIGRRDYVHVYNINTHDDDDPGWRHEPYGLCQYSGLVEILDGHTNEPGRKHRVLKPDPDWLRGCVDVAKWAWEYWNDPGYYQHSHYFTTQVLRQMDIDDRTHGYDWRKNLKPGETPEQYAEGCWQRHWDEQLDYLRRFKTKYQDYWYG